MENFYLFDFAGDLVVDNNDEGEIDFDTTDIEEDSNENDSNENDSNENNLNDETESENNEKDGKTVDKQVTLEYYWGKLAKHFPSDKYFSRWKFSSKKIFPDEIFPDKVINSSIYWADHVTTKLRP